MSWGSQSLMLGRENVRNDFDSKLKKYQSDENMVRYSVNLDQKINNIYLPQLLYQQNKKQAALNHHQEIEKRRSKLICLYQNEQSEWKKELGEYYLESPKQKKDKMLLKSIEFSETKEAARKNMADQKKRQRMIENSDELRKIKSDIATLKNSYELDQLLIEKQKRLVDDYQNEMVYAKLWEIDTIKKKRQEDAILQKQRQMMGDLKYSLDQQKKVNEHSRNIEYHNKLQEQEELKKQFEKNDLEFFRAERDKKQRLLKMNEEINTTNKEVLAKKARAVELERQIDKTRLDEQLDIEKKLAEIERHNRSKIQQENKQFLMNSRVRYNEFAKQEAEANKYIENEREKFQLNQSKKWEEQAEANKKLLIECYGQRAALLQQKFNENEQMKKNIEAQRIELQKDLELKKAEAEMQKIQEIKKNQQYKNDILNQISIKNQIKRDQARQIELDRIKNLEMEKEYQQFLNNERQNHLSSINNLRTSHKPIV